MTKLPTPLPSCLFLLTALCNQKSPLGAGPYLCTARTPSQDAHNPLPYQRGRVPDLRDERNSALCSGGPPDRARDRKPTGFRKMSGQLQLGESPLQYGLAKTITHNIALTWATRGWPYNSNNGAKCPAYNGQSTPRSLALHSNPPGGCVGGFSALFRPAPWFRNGWKGQRAPKRVDTVEGFRGKAAPRRLSGAVLFGPFSWAYKKKGVKIINKNLTPKSQPLPKFPAFGGKREAKDKNKTHISPDSMPPEGSLKP